MRVAGLGSRRGVTGAEVLAAVAAARAAFGAPALDALAALPADTRVCCAHEYTLGNLRFAQAVEPGNTQLTQYMAQCTALRERGTPTLPSRMGTERSVNPFLRSREASVRRAVQAHAGLDTQAADADVFAALRQWKNEFR